MRIWKKIKVNNIVTYKNEKYIVIKIYEFDTTIYADLKNINTGGMCSAPLYSCKIDEN